MSKTPEKSVRKTIFGVPVLMENSIGPSYSGDEEKDWVLVIKQGQETEAVVHRVCQAVNCTGEERKLGLITFHGTEQELFELVAQNQDEIESIETDGEATAIPDFPDESVDASRSVAANVKSWGLDRIDDRRGLDNSYNPPAGGGRGVHVYVTDTGIRTTHNDFGGRAIPTLEIVGNGVRVCRGNVNCAADRAGHGTHCAGTVGGSHYGVAKQVTLHAVKILSDSGSGQFSWFTQALDWIVLNGQRPAIVSASLGGGGTHNFVKVAVDRTVNAGVVVVVAAGNNRANACGFTPAYIPSVINVGATQSNDQRAGFSNYGQCLDIFAPGVNIISAGHRSNTATARMQGTSMACPHVAGAAALVLQKEPNLMPGAVEQRLLANATKNIVTSPQGSPNNFLYVGMGSTPPTAPPTTTL